MDREILFRGKHIHAFLQYKYLDGKWVYGYLSDENYINSLELQGEFLVNKDTISQYTGLNDKYGRKIFEGDIVKDEYGEIYTVNWSDENGMYELRQYDCSMENFEIFSAIGCEVIGNIYDNPELLEV